MLTVVGEVGGRGVEKATLEALGVGREVSSRMGAPLSLLLLGEKVREQAEEMRKFCERVYVAEDPLLGRFHPEVWVEVLEHFCRRENPLALFLSHTKRGEDLAPRLAARLGVLPVTDCVFVEVEGENLRCHKPIYGGRFLALLEVKDRPKLLTIRMGSGSPPHPSLSPGEVVELPLPELHPWEETLEEVEEEAPGLEEAEIVLAGGRGMGGKKGFGILQELAEVLRGRGRKVAVGASRPPCDLGWVPKSWQVGLTGTKVSPRLYLAVGISGSVQHLAGVMGAKTIVAVNRDSQAPILECSDLAVVGEWERVLPSFLARLREKHEGGGVR